MDFGFILAPIVLFALAAVLLAVGIANRKKGIKLGGFVLAIFAVVALASFATYNMIHVNRNEGLFIAAQKGDAQEVRYLLRQGADPEAEWESGETALQVAEEGGHKEVVKILRAAGARR